MDSLQTQLSEYVRTKKERSPADNDYIRVFLYDTTASKYRFDSSYIFNGDNWEKYSIEDNMAEATKEDLGSVRYATDTEAKQGTSTDSAMSPDNVSQYLDTIEYYDEW